MVQTARVHDGKSSVSASEAVEIVAELGQALIA
jgi:hypothetical protein